MNRTILVALSALFILWLLYVIYNYKVAQTSYMHAPEKEAVMKYQIGQLKTKLETLKLEDSLKDVRYRKSIDSAQSLAREVIKVKTVYVKVREATDLKPDSINLLAEVQESRKVINKQDKHINALLKVNLEADELLKSRLDIITNLEDQLKIWPERFLNQESDHKAKLKRERRKGDGKFLKGAGLGAVLTVVFMFN